MIKRIGICSTTTDDRLITWCKHGFYIAIPFDDMVPTRLSNTLGRTSSHQPDQGAANSETVIWRTGT